MPKKKRGCVIRHSLLFGVYGSGLGYGAGGYEGLAGGVVFKLLEVVDELLGEHGSLLLPFFGISVGVTRVENLGIHSGEFGGHGESEDRNLLGGSGQDSSVKDSIDDAAGVADRDALSGSVPAGVNEISLSAALFHLLDEFFSILGGVEAEECCAEASREGGGGLGDAAFGTGELRGVAAQEVVLGLFRSKDRHGGQHAVSVG